MIEPSESAGTAVMEPRQSLLRAMSSRRIVWAAMKVSFVVGAILNLINNGPQGWQQHSVVLWKVLLNYAVPFRVSSYSAARNEVNRRCD